jgi:predicted LPLAT superfamily acyltransferase
VTLPKDVPPAGWDAEQERGSSLAVTLIGWLSRAFGRRATRWLLYPISWYFVAFSPRARRASRAFLRRALGREPHLGDLQRHFHTFAATIHDRVFLLTGQEGLFDIEVHGAETVERIVRSGRGCILLGSHLGSFEVLRALARVAEIRAVNVVMRSLDTAHTARTLSRMAPEFENRIIAPGRPDTMLRVKECLERGEIVGFLGDRTLRGARTRACEFLGVAAEFPLGPLQIAAAAGAPVITFFALYEGGPRYQVFLEGLSEGAVVPKAERTAWAANRLDRYVERLERYACRSPYNWFNFYDYWNENPR